MCFFSAQKVTHFKWVTFPLRQSMNCFVQALRAADFVFQSGSLLGHLYTIYKVGQFCLNKNDDDDDYDVDYDDRNGDD